MTKRDKPHITYFNVGFLPIKFGFTTSRLNFEAEMKRLNAEIIPEWVPAGSDGATHRLDPEHGHPIYIVCIRKSGYGKRHALMSLAVHEATHVWHGALESMRTETPGGETECYAIQYLSHCIMSEL